MSVTNKWQKAKDGDLSRCHGCKDGRKGAV